MLGLFTPLLETPSLGKAFFDVTIELGKLPGLNATARETVILATGSFYQSSYEIYAHERVALEKSNLTREQIDLIKHGKKPEDLDSGSSVAFDAAIQLTAKPGPLSDETYERLVKEFGKQGTLAVLHYVGVYAYTCVLLNGCAVSVPEGENIM